MIETQTKLIPDFYDFTTEKEIDIKGNKFQIIDAEIIENMFPMFEFVLAKFDNKKIYINNNTLGVDLLQLLPGNKLRLIIQNSVALKAMQPE